MNKKQRLSEKRVHVFSAFSSLISLDWNDYTGTINYKILEELFSHKFSISKALHSLYVC